MLWPEVSARQAYPLYYNLARPFVSAAAPCRSRAGAESVLRGLGRRRGGAARSPCARRSPDRLTGGVVAGGLLAFSYTFWTQAIIAEVYTLHLALIGLCLLLLGAVRGQANRTRA